MSLNSFSENNNAQSPRNEGNAMKAQSNPLFALLGQANLISSTHNITEVKDIVDSLNEMIKHLLKNTASEGQKLALPTQIQQLTQDISPQLPGVNLSTVINGVCYTMPVLFFKNGVTEVTESIYLQNEAMPRGIAKVASSFMTQELMEKLKANHAYRDGKQMANVIIVSPQVINLEAFLKNTIKYEDMIADVRDSLLKEFTTGLVNMVYLEAGKTGVEIPTLFKDGKMFGQDNAAVARVEPVNKQVIDGRMTPYNLAVRLSTTNKNNTQSATSNNTRSVATSYMRVSLEAMAGPQFIQARNANPAKTVGPLVPVISVGQTIPGETLNNNSGMLAALLGLYASIGANQIQYFSEAFRNKEVGHSGNIGNFNHYLSQMLPGLFKVENYITDKNIANVQVVNDWLQRYIAPNAVYVMDLSTYSDDVSNTDFWWNIVGKQSGSTYHRTLVALMDQLSNNTFSKKVAENTAKGTNRDPRKDWTMADPILVPTQVIIPTGIAMDKNGKWFDLSEVDGMFLRQDSYYGQNEPAVNDYLGLISGASGGELKVRQFNIYNRLNQLFSNNVIIDGWKRRFIISDSFLNTQAQSMATSGSMSMSSPAMQSMWTMQYSNEYLNYTTTAGLASQVNLGGMGMNGGYTQYQ